MFAPWTSAVMAPVHAVHEVEEIRCCPCYAAAVQGQGPVASKAPVHSLVEKAHV